MLMDLHQEKMIINHGEEVKEMNLQEIYDEIGMNHLEIYDVIETTPDVMSKIGDLLLIDEIRTDLNEGVILTDGGDEVVMMTSGGVVVTLVLEIATGEMMTLEEVVVAMKTLEEVEDVMMVSGEAVGVTMTLGEAVVVTRALGEVVTVMTALEEVVTVMTEGLVTEMIVTWVDEQTEGEFIKYKQRYMSLLKC